MEKTQRVQGRYIQDFPLDKFLKINDVKFEDKPKYYVLQSCPSCGKQKKLIINKKNKYFICFVCGIKGSLVNFIDSITGCGWQEAVRIINSHTNFTPSSALKSTILKDPIFDPVDIQPISLPFYFNRINLFNGSDASSYLLGRGYNQELVDYFDIRYSPQSKRVIFPIHDVIGNVVGWQARDITGSHHIKILTKPNGLKKSSLVYNLHNIFDKDSITICEGPTDCHKSFRMNSVCLFGKQFSESQVNIIKTMPNLKTVYIGLDSDAIDQSKKLADRFAYEYDVKIVSLPSGIKDLGECSVDLASSCILNSTTFQEYDLELRSHLL